VTVPKLLIPVKKYRQLPGFFTWSDRPVLGSVRSADLLPLTQLSEDLRKASGARPIIIRDAVSTTDVRIRRDSKMRGEEAYRLSVTPQEIEILASGDAGAYYAIQTLRELVQIARRRIRCCIIDDYPDFARRAVYEDCSRGKVPKLETIKQLVERLARWKINELQLYVENVFTFKRHPAIGRGYSPFTPADILEIQEFCKQHHVRLVGSLTSFGHMDKILKLKEYAHLAELPPRTRWDETYTLCPTDRGSIRLVADMYDEFAPLFEEVDFNSCCDETWELGKGRSKNRADRIGIGALYVEFLLKIHKLCLKHGKRMNIWADILMNHPKTLKKLPRDIVLLNWDYNPGGRRIPRSAELAAAGFPFMVCPGTSSWQTHNARLHVSIPNISQFVRAARKYGAEGVLNTDWGDCGHRNLLGTALHGFAHGAAHSWNGRDVDDSTFTDLFTRRVFAQTDGKLARRLLGASAIYRTREGKSYSSALYHTLIEPLRGRWNPRRAAIDEANPRGLEKVISKLSGKDIFPDPPTRLDRFEQLAFKEFALAGSMDVLAARRALAGFKIRAGQHVPASELRDQARQMQRISREFEKLWGERNRPSRLRDNLRHFARCRSEALRLAKR